MCIIDEVGSGGALVKNLKYVEEALADSFPDGKVVAIGIGNSSNRRGVFQSLRAKGVIH